MWGSTGRFVFRVSGSHLVCLAGSLFPLTDGPGQDPNAPWSFRVLLVAAGFLCYSDVSLSGGRFSVPPSRGSAGSSSGDGVASHSSTR